MAENRKNYYRIVEIMLVIFLAIMSAVVFHFTAYSSMASEVRANSENIDSQERRFDRIEKKIENLDAKMEVRLNALDAKIEKKFNLLVSKIEKLNDKLDLALLRGK